MDCYLLLRSRNFAALDDSASPPWYLKQNDATASVSCSIDTSNTTSWSGLGCQSKNGKRSLIFSGDFENENHCAYWPFSFEFKASTLDRDSHNVNS